MTAKTLVLGLALLGGSVGAQQTSAAAPAIALRVQPDRICADSRSGYPNFDLLVRNGSARPATVVELTARSFDTAGNLLEHRILWQDALSILGTQRVIAAGEEGVIFNPFSFESAGRAARIDYQLRFDDGASASVSIRPEPCATRARLILPLTGRVLVYDSYDFLSHHRRQTYQYAADLRTFGVVDNWYRFGIDLVAIDEAGGMFKGEGARIADWYGWGLPVRAAGEGVVVAVRDDMPDNALGSEDWPRKRLSEDEMGSDGNLRPHRSWRRRDELRLSPQARQRPRQEGGSGAGRSGHHADRQLGSDPGAAPPLRVAHRLGSEGRAQPTAVLPRSRHPRPGPIQGSATGRDRRRPAAALTRQR